MGLESGDEHPPTKPPTCTAKSKRLRRPIASSLNGYFDFRYDDQYYEEDYHESLREGAVKRERLSAETSDEQADPVWYCPCCTFDNHPLLMSCEMCDAPRPTSGIGDTEYDLMAAAEFCDLIECPDSFECPICFTDYEPGIGVMLRSCLHTFCPTCLAGHIKSSENAVVSCPYSDGSNQCHGSLQDREIRALVSDDEFEKHLQLSSREAESQAGDRSYHCVTPDCPGWCLHENGAPPIVNGEVALPPAWHVFLCPVCTKSNCMQCRAVHDGEDCRQYQQRINQTAVNDKNAELAIKELQRLLSAGEAMKCPQCSVIITKQAGCDWLVCSICKTEICWATRQARWGPKGRGDTSGGCRCNCVPGVLCHPNCQNCH